MYSYQIISVCSSASINLEWDATYFVLENEMSFHTDRYCQKWVSIQKHMIFGGHIHYLGGIYRILKKILLKFSFSMSLHYRLIIANWRLSGSSTAQLNRFWNMEISALHWGLKNAAGTMVWSLKIHLLHICLRMKLSLLILIDDSTEKNIPMIKKFRRLYCNLCFAHCLFDI